MIALFLLLLIKENVPQRGHNAGVFRQTALVSSRLTLGPLVLRTSLNGLALRASLDGLVLRTSLVGLALRASRDGLVRRTSLYGLALRASLVGLGAEHQALTAKHQLWKH